MYIARVLRVCTCVCACVWRTRARVEGAGDCVCFNILPKSQALYLAAIFSQESTTSWCLEEGADPEHGVYGACVRVRICVYVSAPTPVSPNRWYAKRDGGNLVLESYVCCWKRRSALYLLPRVLQTVLSAGVDAKPPGWRECHIPSLARVMWRPALADLFARESR